MFHRVNDYFRSAGQAERLALEVLQQERMRPGAERRALNGSKADAVKVYCNNGLETQKKGNLHLIYSSRKQKETRRKNTELLKVRDEVAPEGTREKEEAAAPELYSAAPELATLCLEGLNQESCGESPVNDLKHDGKPKRGNQRQLETE